MRAMYIWNLKNCLKRGTVADMVVKAQAAKLSSLWVKIGDGAEPFQNIKGSTAKLFSDLVAGCAAAKITVLGYHVPHCADLASTQREVDFVAETVQNFNLGGVVVDNEDGPGFFEGDKDTASAYGQELQARMHAAKKLVVMSSNDILSSHEKSYGTVIGGFIDINAPQVYYGQSPSVDSRLNWALRENKKIKAPFFPVGAAFLRKPSESDGGFLDPVKCGQAAAHFIQLVSILHNSDPDMYPGYGFWDWEEAPDEVWKVLNDTDVFVSTEDHMDMVTASLRVGPDSDILGGAASEQGSLSSVLELYAARADCLSFTGRQLPDLNLPGNTLLIVSESEFYSFRKADIVEVDTLSDQTSRVWVRRGTKAWRSTSFGVGKPLQLRETRVGMEDLPEPPSSVVPGMPARALAEHQAEILALNPPSRSIVAAAGAYSGQCTGGDRYANNCAHFLSDAFIRAGYDELLVGHSADHFISARCGTPAKRAIRARDMWQWFQSMATATCTQMVRNTGMWSVFQLDEKVYWGGHVVIIDTDRWTFHGTGCHWDWDQHGYKW